MKTEIRSFEDLEVWKYARILQTRISKMVKSFPDIERYRLTDQLIRSSRSISSNIAEGYGRYHYQENIQFCRQARGSLNELLNDLITAYEEKYIDQSNYYSVRKDVNTCLKLLNGYIAYLKNAKQDYDAREDETNYRLPSVEQVSDKPITDNK